MAKKYKVYSYDGHENCKVVATFGTLDEAEADRDARNTAEEPKRRGDVEDLYYEVEEPEEQAEDEWQYKRCEARFHQKDGSAKVEQWDVWRIDLDERSKTGAWLQAEITHFIGGDEYVLKASIIYKSQQVYARCFNGDQGKVFDNLETAKKEAVRWLTLSPQGITSLDIGFDMKLDDRDLLVPFEGIVYYRYNDKKGDVRLIRAPAQEAVEVLRKVGYKVRFDRSIAPM